MRIRTRVINNVISCSDRIQMSLGFLLYKYKYGSTAGSSKAWRNSLDAGEASRLCKARRAEADNEAEAVEIERWMLQRWPKVVKSKQLVAQIWRGG